MLAFLTKAKKFVTAIAGVVGILVSSGYLHGNTEFYVNLAIGAVMAVLVYLIPNVKTAAAPNA